MSIHSYDYEDSFYIPKIVPKEDLEAFSRYTRAGFASRGLGDRPAIIVIDVTYAFVEDKYFAGYSKTAKPCARAIAKLLEKARWLRIPVFYTKSDMEAKRIEVIIDAESERSKNIEEMTSANEIVEEIAPLKTDIVIKKAGPSAFFGTPLSMLLNRLKIDTVIVTGLVTSGCVRATAVDAFSHQYRVIVPVECTADRSQISHEISLFDLSMKYAHVLPLDNLVYLLEAKQKSQG